MPQVVRVTSLRRHHRDSVLRRGVDRKGLHPAEPGLDPGKPGRGAGAAKDPAPLQGVAAEPHGTLVALTYP